MSWVAGGTTLHRIGRCTIQVLDRTDDCFDFEEHVGEGLGRFCWSDYGARGQYEYELDRGNNRAFIWAVDETWLNSILASQEGSFEEIVQAFEERFRKTLSYLRRLAKGDIYVAFVEVRVLWSGLPLGSAGISGVEVNTKEDVFSAVKNYGLVEEALQEAKREARLRYLDAPRAARREERHG